MKVQKFEDLRCWQASRQLVKLVFLAGSSGPLATDFNMRYQFQKAALSSMNNIAEGFGRFGVKDSIKFYDISQSSALEVKSMLYVLADLEYLQTKDFQDLKAKADETRNLTLAFIRYLRGTMKKKKRNDKGPNDAVSK